jgi:ribosomal peptide maturation radical SAM protein 1
MPWAWIDAPSIQCGLLQAVVREAGHQCDVHYLNIDLADILGPEIYNKVATMNDDRFHQLGEWLFSYSAFGDIKPEEEYLAEYSEVAAFWSRFLPGGPDRLVRYRREVLPEWLDGCADSMGWASYDAIGFSSTFMQNAASLAMGRRLKARFPDIPLIYGGANFDGTMGPAYAEKLPWLDYVVCGEGDIALPELLYALAAGTTDPIPGVHHQGADAAEVGESARTRELDELPIPDYRDYFASLQRAGRSAALSRTRARLPVEFSRGCWWGEKHHCTFCGLNNLGINFRSKSGQRAFSELETLLRAYPATRVDAVDNILDMKYLSSFCADLADRHWDIDMFFEVKANLTRDQLALMRKAGIRRIQPGIESLSSHVLGLMRKGATKLINVRILKWARYYGVATEWHMLSGFPGESDEDYREQARLLPLLHHLQPPQSQIGIWLERFSPYFTDSSFPIRNIRPQASYQYVYPPSLDYSRIAYFFDYEASELASPQSREQLGLAVDEWRLRWASGNPPNLFYQRLPESLTVVDSRDGQARRAALTGWRADAYEACGDTARSDKRVHQGLLDRGFQVSLGTVTGFLDDCCAAGLMISEEDKYLALAIPGNEGW